MTPFEHPIPRLVRRVLIPALSALGCAGLLSGQTALVANSPFAPSSVVGAAAAPAEAYQLAGASVQGSDTTVCIYAQQTKRSQWIPVGGESDGIHVISYDGARDTAIVMIAGSRREISMRKTVVSSVGQFAASRPFQPAEAPAAAVVPISSAAPEPADKLVQEQREARMLVSDLLEIGVQQRKAYQEAKQRAASGAQPP